MIVLPHRGSPPAGIAICSPTDPRPDSVRTMRSGRRFAAVRAFAHCVRHIQLQKSCNHPARNRYTLVARLSGICWDRCCGQWFRWVAATPLLESETNLLSSSPAVAGILLIRRSARPFRHARVRQSAPERRVQIDRAAALCVPAPRAGSWQLSFVRCPAPAAISACFKSSSRLLPQGRIHQQPPIDPANRSGRSSHLHEIVPLGQRVHAIAVPQECPAARAPAPRCSTA